MRTSKKKAEDLKKGNALELIMKITELTHDKGEISTEGSVKPYLTELAKRLELTPKQALFLSVFVDQCTDHHINPCDIARHFDVRPIQVIVESSHINELVEKGAIIKRTSDDDESYRVHPKLLSCLGKDKLPETEPAINLKPFDLMDYIFDILKKRNNREIDDDTLALRIHKVIADNMHLDICKNLTNLKLCDEDLVLFLVLSMHSIDNNDDYICSGDIEDFIPRRIRRKQCSLLENNAHILNCKNLVEPVCNEGKVDPMHWKLTDNCKMEFYAELGLKKEKTNRAGVMQYNDISEKKLYYNDKVSKQVNGLFELLDENRMKRVMERLKEKGFRRGFTCLFYGAPGTGKTETVLQLARQTGRDIMLVDVPEIRSKWVGETEKNIKAVFDHYRRLAKENEKAPILVFNEADAILNKRNEGAQGSVDKMENAMQNIILQEMENLEGIMIATTNLTGNLDAAFERRFLYKVEFEKPTDKERAHIWRMFLPELNEKDIEHLAMCYDLSGGQIENIARKHAIATILADKDTLSMEEIEESCKQEKLYKNQNFRIGFA